MAYSFLVYSFISVQNALKPASVKGLSVFVSFHSMRNYTFDPITSFSGMMSR
jgi:hypothetical protein